MSFSIFKKGGERMANLDAKRYNRAKAQVSGKDLAQFNSGRDIATSRDNPMSSNSKGAHHTSDGKRAE